MRYVAASVVTENKYRCMLKICLTIGQMKLLVLWNRSYNNVRRFIIIEVVWCPDVLQLFLKLKEYTEVHKKAIFILLLEFWTLILWVLCHQKCFITYTRRDLSIMHYLHDK